MVEIKITKETTIIQLAGIVSQVLNDAGITAVLSGGAAVAAYTDNRYESLDLDFVTSAGLSMIDKALGTIGFVRGASRRQFEHSNTDYYIEFPPGPLTVGEKHIHEWEQLDTEYGRVNILSPTQVIMDRLAGYFYWNDPQSLEQAIMIVESQPIDWAELDIWAGDEREPEKYQTFLRRAGRE